VTVQNVESDINCALKIEVYQIVWLSIFMLKNFISYANPSELYMVSL